MEDYVLIKKNKGSMKEVENAYYSLRQYLEPFASTTRSDGRIDTTLELAENAYHMLKSDTAIIQQLQRENEQLQDALQEVISNREEMYNNAVAEIEKLKLMLTWKLITTTLH